MTMTMVDKGEFLSLCTETDHFDQFRVPTGLVKMLSCVHSRCVSTEHRRC